MIMKTSPINRLQLYSYIAEEVDGSYCLQMAGKWPWPGQAGRGRERIASSEMSSGARASSSSLVLCSQGSASRAETEQLVLEKVPSEGS